MGSSRVALPATILADYYICISNIAYLIRDLCMYQMSKYFLAHVPNAIATKYILQWQRSPQALQVIIG